MTDGMVAVLHVWNTFINPLAQQILADLSPDLVAAIKSPGKCAFPGCTNPSDRGFTLKLMNVKGQPELRCCSAAHRQGVMAEFGLDDNVEIRNR